MEEIRTQFWVLNTKVYQSESDFLDAGDEDRLDLELAEDLERDRLRDLDLDLDLNKYFSKLVLEIFRIEHVFSI